MQRGMEAGLRGPACMRAWKAEGARTFGWTARHRHLYVSIRPNVQALVMSLFLRNEVNSRFEGQRNVYFCVGGETSFSICAYLTLTHRDSASCTAHARCPAAPCHRAAMPCCRARVLWLLAAGHGHTRVVLLAPRHRARPCYTYIGRETNVQ